MSIVAGKHTLQEISEQHEALRGAWEQLQQQADWVQQYVGNSAFEEVVFIGSGSSYYQALTMAATFRKWTGRSSAAYPSSDIFLFREQTLNVNKKLLIVGVSRSGESHEVIHALQSIKDVENWTHCGITCYENSTLGQMTACLLSPLGQEKSTVMTKSLSSMTFMMQAAIAASIGNETLLEEMKQVLAQHEQIVQAARIDAERWVQAHTFRHTVFLGMGAYGGLAMEASLKLKEMTCTWTEAYGTLEFRHGPKSIIDAQSQVVLLLSDSARAYELKVARELKGYGATVVILTSAAGNDTEFADHVIELGGAVLGDEARSVLYLPWLQYNGYYTSMKLGLNPDDPRNLTQFVEI